MIVGIHLKGLVGESASDALDQDESKIELGALVFKSVAQRAKKLCAPDGLAGAAESVPVGFCDVNAGWALVGWGTFDSMHVSVIGQMAACEFNNENIGGVLPSGECLCRDIPVDGLEGALGPVVLFHWLLAEACVLDCLLLVKVVGQSIGCQFSR